LARAGAVLVDVPVGEWTLPDDLRPAIRLLDAIIAGNLHAVTFTSAPAVRNLFLLAEEFDRVDDLRAALDGLVVPVCVGPVCVTAARRCGLRHLEMPAKFRLEPMVRELADALAARVRHFRFDGHEVVLRGSVIEVDTTRIELADREAGVLRMLTTNPGVPLSKRELLHEVWGDRQRDDHVVEVTVARLRRRLGECSDVIVAVPRRGYRFEGVAAA
jgi:uroporphyrinogen-III synthase